MLETMAHFFNSRLAEYEAHQLCAIEGARSFYPFTAAQLPRQERAEILDLGCGTGLELEAYYAVNPTAHVTGIDLAGDLLRVLERKFPRAFITVVEGSYFSVPLGEGRYDAAESVESLHHFTQAEKIPLYKSVRRALRPNGFFLLTDYFAATAEEENAMRQAFLREKAALCLPDGEYYHYDTPLTLEHECQALTAAGFSAVECLGQWGSTATLKAWNHAGL